jgi:predicted N-formylglutamate amidohydrolase
LRSERSACVLVAASAESLLTDYVEIIPRRAPDAAAFLTCEHASRELPPPFRWPDEDAWLTGTHWAYDLGAAELTRELAGELGAGAVLSRFSRLLIDPNRSEAAPDTFRANAEGRTVFLNRDIGDDERARRFEIARAYHAAIDDALSSDAAPVVLSIHTFTPLYEGLRRSVEVGVLFDEEELLAERVRATLADNGFHALLNEPYSGKAGLIYSAERHARRHGRRALELELRQDLACDASARARVVSVLCRVLAA